MERRTIMKRIVSVVLIFPALAFSATVVNSFDAPDTGISGLAWDGTNLWAVDGLTQYVYELDASNGDVLSSFYITDQTSTYNPVPGGFAYLEGTLCVIMYDGTSYGHAYLYDTSGAFLGHFDVYC